MITGNQRDSDQRRSPAYVGGVRSPFISHSLRTAARSFSSSVIRHVLRELINGKIVSTYEPRH
eukprot:1412640-Pyramimonas_sp.AAC.2